MMTNTAGYFDRLATEWTEKYVRSVYFRQRLETALSWVAPEPAGTSLLDFGCGTGVMVRALVERGFTVTGVDASPRMIESARQSLGSGDVPLRYQLESIDGDRFGGTYLTAHYRGVIVLGVLEYVPDAFALLQQLAGVIEEGGFLLLSLPNRTSVLRKLEGFVYRHPRVFGRSAIFAHLTCPDSYLRFQKHQFTLRSVHAQLAAAGFAGERMLYQVAPPFLRGIEHHPRVGMTMMLKYRRLRSVPDGRQASGPADPRSEPLPPSITNSAAGRAVR